MPEKLKMHTPDLTAQNIQKLAELFPDCVTEIRDEAGKVSQGIDFDQLRQELSGSIVEGPRERYHLDWPGKREAILAANAPIAKTLRPNREESVNFDTTKNLFIEGDNLDALKLLQETYLGKVKLIYIDPPYNTGNDFIYEDNFAEVNEDFLLRSNQKDESGNRMVANTEANGRFHSDWLSMIYPRLKLARNLLSDDGMIFVNIDDGEAATLKLLMVEIFGEDNFLAAISWEKRYTRSNNARMFYSIKDTLIAFRKSSVLNRIREPRSEESKEIYNNPDADERGDWTSSSYVNPATKEQRPNLVYKIDNPFTKEIIEHPTHAWKYEYSEHLRQVQENRLWWGQNGDAKYPRLKNFLHEMQDGMVPIDLWDYQTTGTTDEGGIELKSLFQEVVFDNPKPTRLIRRIVRLINSDNTDQSAHSDIILDFFAGSGTTAHAVMAQNAEDGKSRRYILVQLPEVLNRDDKGQQAASDFCAKLGRPLTIAEITKERLRRAASKLVEENPLFAGDTAFRVLKIDNSNMLDVYYTPDAVAQGDLLGQVDNIRPDRSPEDLLFQVLVDWGLDLALPIAEETIEDKKVFFVDKNALVACFDSGVTDEMVKAIALRKPLRAVFRDSSYGTDSVKINVEQIFKLLSPETEVRSI
jgi:adenine-specific DNA-methyltransferase